MQAQLDRLLEGKSMYNVPAHSKFKRVVLARNVNNRLTFVEYSTHRDTRTRVHRPFTKLGTDVTEQAVESTSPKDKVARPQTLNSQSSSSTVRRRCQTERGTYTAAVLAQKQHGCYSFTRVTSVATITSCCDGDDQRKRSADGVVAVP